MDERGRASALGLPKCATTLSLSVWIVNNKGEISVLGSSATPYVAEELRPCLQPSFLRSYPTHNVTTMRNSCPL